MAATQCTERLVEFSVTSFLHSIKAAMIILTCHDIQRNDFRIRFIYLWYVLMTVLHRDLWLGKFSSPYSSEVNLAKESSASSTEAMWHRFDIFKLLFLKKYAASIEAKFQI